MAVCGAGGAYLESWSPAQGYEATSVVRGPAPQAQAVFRNGHSQITMLITCRGGLPSARSRTQDLPGDD